MSNGAGVEELAYTPTNWVDGTTPVNAANLNKIEAALQATDLAATQAKAGNPPSPTGQDGKWLSVSGGAMVWVAGPSGGGVDYKGPWGAATPFASGDVVTNGGVTYLAVNPGTGQTPPLFAAAPGVMGAINLVTSLPASPFDGQEVILTDSLTAPTYSWRLRYVGAKASNKWVFVGGAPAFSQVLTSEVTSSATYVALTTAGPSVVVPVAGVYVIEIGAQMTYSAGSFSAGYMSYDIGATGAVDADAIADVTLGGGPHGESVKAQQKTLTAVTLTAKYRTAGEGRAYSGRWMRVTPVAIGG